VSVARPPAGVRLCALDDLPDPGARGFAFDPPEGAPQDAWPFRGLVVRAAGEVRGYVDSCPHIGAPLSADPERYLTRRGDFLMCFNHGALFRIEDGVCVAGPCVTRALRPWEVRVADGEVVTA
jgi:nitrite reductase/ring-hydroxylating ferredoxin subunit